MAGELAPAVMTESEARFLTDRIAKNFERGFELLYEAHERRAWAALGYGSFKEYVKVEFDMSRSRAYQVINQGRVVREISAAVSTSVDISEAAARELEPVLPEVQARIRRRIAVAGPQDDPVEIATAMIEEARRELRARRQEAAEREAARAETARRLADLQASPAFHRVVEDGAVMPAAPVQTVEVRVANPDEQRRRPAAEDAGLSLVDSAVRDAHHSAWNALGVLEGLDLERVGRLLTQAERDEYAELADTMEMWLARYRVALWSAAAADEVDEEAR
jgi:hypothetical protein